MVERLKKLLLSRDGKGKGPLVRYYGVAFVLLAGICLMLWPGETVDSSQGQSGAREMLELDLQAEDKQRRLDAAARGDFRVRLD